MSNIIAFPTDRRPPPAPTPDTGRARILLFTGIRYVRDEAEAPARPESPAPQPVAEDRLQA